MHLMFNRILIAATTVVCINFSAQATEPSKPEWESITKDILKNPKLISKSWKKINPILPHCSKSDSTELKCENIPGIQSIHLEEGETGTIAAVEVSVTKAGEESPGFNGQGAR